MLLVQRNMEEELDEMPPGLDEFESHVARKQQKKQRLAGSLRRAGQITRGVIIFDMLFANVSFHRFLWFICSSSRS